MATSSQTTRAAIDGVSLDRMPRHIAIIMDGNGRWARQRGLPRIEGHRQGATSVQPRHRRMRPAGHRTNHPLLPLQRELETSGRGTRFSPPTAWSNTWSKQRPKIMEQNIRVRCDRPPRGTARGRGAGTRSKRFGHEPRRTPVCACAWPSTTAAGPNWSMPLRHIASRGAAGARFDPSDDQRRDANHPALHGQHAGTRSADSHGRRDADQQFSLVADQLRGTLGHGSLLAGFRRGPASCGDPQLCLAASAIRRSGAVRCLIPHSCRCMTRASRCVRTWSESLGPAWGPWPTCSSPWDGN